jgi:hypothetical protein
MTIALLLLIAGKWLRRASRSLPLPVARPRFIIEIEIRRIDHG